MVGIGLGIVRYLLKHDQELMVVATSRNAKETRRAILENEEKDVSERLRVLNVDVTKEDQIHSARKTVEEEFGKGTIKALFNVSGIVCSSLPRLTSSILRKQSQKSPTSICSKRSRSTPLDRY